MMEESTTPAATSDYGYISEGKVYRNAFLEFPERQIGEVKNDEAFSIRYFTKRFEVLNQKVDTLLADIAQAQNKGSFLMKMLHLRSILPAFDALGDFAPLSEKLQNAQDEIMGLIEQNRNRNLEIKQALLAETEAAVTNVTDWGVSGEKIKELKEKWLKTGSVAPELQEDTEGAFTAMLNHFYHSRKLFYDDRQRVMFERIELYKAVLNKAIPLIKREANPSHSLREFKNLQTEWRAIGLIPKAHLEPIITEFKRIQKTILRNLKYAKEKEMASRPLTPAEKMAVECLLQKKVLLEEAKGLANMDLRMAFEKARDLQAKWKLIGPVPDRDKRYVNETFTYLCDRIFEMSYLMRTVYVSNRFFNSKPPAEQTNIKIAALKEIIRKDEIEMASLDEAFNKLSPTEQRNPVNKVLYLKVSTQRRKLKVKEQLIGELLQLAAAQSITR